MSISQNPKNELWDMTNLNVSNSPPIQNILCADYQWVGGTKLKISKKNIILKINHIFASE